MANITPISSFDDVYRISPSDNVDATGGPFDANGIANRQAQQLANRTKWIIDNAPVNKTPIDTFHPDTVLTIPLDLAPGHYLITNSEHINLRGGLVVFADTQETTFRSLQVLYQYISPTDPFHVSFRTILDDKASPWHNVENANSIRGREVTFNSPVDGQVLGFDGGVIKNISPPPAGTFTTNRVIFNTPGTYSWVVPADVSSIFPIVIGGGGGGGGGGNDGAYWGNGGTSSSGPWTPGFVLGAEYVLYQNISVVPGETLSIIVGNNGSGGATGGAGEDGGDGEGGGDSKIVRVSNSTDLIISVAGYGGRSASSTANRTDYIQTAFGSSTYMGYAPPLGIAYVDSTVGPGCGGPGGKKILAISGSVMTFSGVSGGSGLVIIEF